MKIVEQYLIHLHPDLENHLKVILREWNSTQSSVEFIGIRPARKPEKLLLTPGSISDDSASNLADEIRNSGGYGSRSGILIFTEKRLYDDDFYQLFVGGRETDDEPPNISILSLDFLRRQYQSAHSRKPLLFRAVISNILFSLGVDAGLEDHDDEIRGCIMDFCENMPDIEIGLKDGPKFCTDCHDFLKDTKAVFLLTLAKVARDFKVKEIDSIDAEVTESILLRGKRYTETAQEFDYDIALSYADADQDHADSLAMVLRRNGFKVFYDEFGRARIWGKNLQTYLMELYRLRAKYCVVLLSVDYTRSRWTKLELEAALAREFEQGNEYILPIKLENVEVDGILPTKAYLNWDEETPESITELIRQKIINVE